MAEQRYFELKNGAVVYPDRKAFLSGHHNYRIVLGPGGIYEGEGAYHTGVAISLLGGEDDNNDAEAYGGGHGPGFDILREVRRIR